MRSMFARISLEPTRGRDTTREALASIVQVTDLHIMDAQSTMRFEYMIDIDPIAFRPHEALGTHAAAQLVARDQPDRLRALQRTHVRLRRLHRRQHGQPRDWSNWTGSSP